MDEYSTIPGYGIYKINKYGDIVCYLENKVQFNVSSFESSTTKGSYKIVNIYNNKLIKKFIAVHQLVCMTYNGKPPDDGLVYVVNHIDGDKHNNYYKNLEWVTNSDNSIHALKNGYE